MSTQTRFSIAVFPGDGIGEEITEPCIELLHQACARTGELTLETQTLAAGAKAYQELGSALPEESLSRARDCDAILLAAMGDPSVRYADGTEIAPQLDLRFELQLYAGIRPVRSIPGVTGPLSDPRAQHLDFVLVRESIEGLFAPRAKGIVIDDREARETLVITRDNSEKLFRATFALAAQRRRRGIGKGLVSCIDKANVFPAFAFFRKIFYEVAEQHDFRTDHAYIDATALNLVTHPWEFDVMVTENMFGDILSDQGAALIGGMGYAPSADIGDKHAVFQPCHGSAPDIAGQGLANPTAMFLSGAMMLEWLAEKHHCDAARAAGDLVVRAVDAAFATGEIKTCELGGNAGLEDVSRAVTAALASLPLNA